MLRTLKSFHKILIIDDDLDLCTTLKSILGSQNGEVQYAHSLKSGKSLLKQLHPDIVFLDNNLPDGLGVDLIKEIKNILPSTFLIFTTALDNSRGKALEYGADVFLEKPLTYRSIFQVLNRKMNLKPEA